MSTGDFFCRMPKSLLDALVDQRLPTHARTILDQLLARLLSMNSENVAQYGTRYKIRPLGRKLKLYPTQVLRGVKALLGRGIVHLKNERLWVIHPSRWFFNDHAPANLLPTVEHHKLQMLVFQKGLIPHPKLGWTYPQKRNYPQDLPSVSTPCSHPSAGVTVGRSLDGTPSLLKRSPAPRASKRELSKESNMVRILTDRIMFIYLWHKGKKVALIDFLPQLLDTNYPGWRESGRDITTLDVTATMQARLESLCDGNWSLTSTEIRGGLAYVADNHAELAAYEAARVRMAALQAEETLFANAEYACEMLLTIQSLNGISEDAWRAVQRWKAGNHNEPEVIIALMEAEQTYGKDGTPRNPEFMYGEYAEYITPRSTEPLRDLPALLSPDRRDTIIFCGIKRLVEKKIVSLYSGEALIQRGVERLIASGVMTARLAQRTEPLTGDSPPWPSRSPRKTRIKKPPTTAQTTAPQSPPPTLKPAPEPALPAHNQPIQPAQELQNTHAAEPEPAAAPAPVAESAPAPTPTHIESAPTLPSTPAPAVATLPAVATPAPAVATPAPAVATLPAVATPAPAVATLPAVATPAPAVATLPAVAIPAPAVATLPAVATPPTAPAPWLSRAPPIPPSTPRMRPAVCPPEPRRPAIPRAALTAEEVARQKAIAAEMSALLTSGMPISEIIARIRATHPPPPPPPPSPARVPERTSEGLRIELRNLYAASDVFIPVQVEAMEARSAHPATTGTLFCDSV